MKNLTNLIINIDAEHSRNIAGSFEKANIKAHTRKTKSGKIAQVKQHQDKRQKKQEIGSGKSKYLGHHYGQEGSELFGRRQATYKVTSAIGIHDAHSNLHKFYYTYEDKESGRKKEVPIMAESWKEADADFHSHMKTANMYDYLGKGGKGVKKESEKKLPKPSKGEGMYVEEEDGNWYIFGDKSGHAYSQHKTKDEAVEALAHHQYMTSGVKDQPSQEEYEADSVKPKKKGSGRFFKMNYDEEGKELTVHFPGGTYTYQKISQNEYDLLSSAKNKGQVFAALKKKKFYTKEGKGEMKKVLDKNKNKVTIDKAKKKIEFYDKKIKWYRDKQEKLFNMKEHLIARSKKEIGSKNLPKINSKIKRINNLLQKIDAKEAQRLRQRKAYTVKIETLSKSVDNDIEKAKIKGYTKTTKSGKQVQVKEHQDKRQNKVEDAGGKKVTYRKLGVGHVFSTDKTPDVHYKVRGALTRDMYTRHINMPVTVVKHPNKKQIGAEVTLTLKKKSLKFNLVGDKSSSTEKKQNELGKIQRMIKSSQKARDTYERDYTQGSSLWHPGGKFFGKQEKLDKWDSKIAKLTEKYKKLRDAK